MNLNPARLAGLPLLLVALAAAGCHSLAPARFPVGLFGVPDPATFPRVQAAGFDIVVAPATRSTLKAAREHGLGILAPPLTFGANGTFDAAAAEARVRRYDRHPALWGWCLADEPDLHRLPPRALQRAHDCLRQAGARKPTALVLFNAREADQYARWADRLLVDRYPIPWLPLADFPKHLRLGRFAAGPRGSLYAVIQAFDWAAFPEALPGQGNFRPPTREETRAMTYLALTEGAQGIFFFTFQSSRWQLTDHPETWEAVCQTVAEVRRREPLFRGTPLWRDFQVRYPDPAVQRNEALDPTVQAALVHVRHGSAEVPGGEYIVAVNTTSNPVAWQFGWPRSPATDIPVLDEGRSLARTGGWYGDTLGPEAVHVYGPLPPRPAAGNGAESVRN